MAATATAALEVSGLTVDIESGGRVRRVLDDVAFTVAPGESIGLVGESGSGKTMTGLAVTGLLPSTARVRGGQVLLQGEDLVPKSSAQMRRILGRRLSMVLQDPGNSLDPSFTIGDQMVERLRLHRSQTGAAARRTAVELLEAVRIPSAASRLRMYPHQLSGGMLQRVCSAMALAGEPQVLIADEPTTALDVTTQAQYLRLLRGLQESTGFALLLITHDLAIVKEMCTRVAVMYAGQIVESGLVSDVTTSPQHPYTRALFAALPTLGDRTPPQPIPGTAPDLADVGDSCHFAPRCPSARDACVVSAPALLPRPGQGPDHRARCFGTQADGWIRDEG